MSLPLWGRWIFEEKCFAFFFEKTDEVLMSEPEKPFVPIIRRLYISKFSSWRIL